MCRATLEGGSRGKAFILGDERKETLESWTKPSSGVLCPNQDGGVLLSLESKHNSRGLKSQLKVKRESQRLDTVLLDTEGVCVLKEAGRNAGENTDSEIQLMLITSQRQFSIQPDSNLETYLPQGWLQKPSLLYSTRAVSRAMLERHLLNSSRT